MTDRAASAGLAVKVLPPVADLFGSNVGIADIHEVTAADLLGRRVIDTDIAHILPAVTDALKTWDGHDLPPESAYAALIADIHAAREAGMLASAGLLHDARRVVLDALTSDPDEPALHQALGNLYQKSGLGELAAESYDEAQFLLTRDAK